MLRRRAASIPAELRRHRSGPDLARAEFKCQAWPIVGTPDDAAQGELYDRLMLRDSLTADARAWLTAHHPGASAQDVACFLLALGNAPSYTQAFREALEAEIVRFPAVTDPDIFNEGVAIGERLLEAWMLSPPPAGTWTQVAAGTPLGDAQVLAGRIAFANGDVRRAAPLHSRVRGLHLQGHGALPASPNPPDRHAHSRGRDPQGCRCHRGHSRRGSRVRRPAGARDSRALRHLVAATLWLSVQSEGENCPGSVLILPAP